MNRIYLDKLCEFAFTTYNNYDFSNKKYFYLFYIYKF